MVKNIFVSLLGLALCILFWGCKKSNPTETIHQTPNTVRITYPPDNVIITDTVTIRVTTTGSKKIARVELYLDSVLINVCTAKPFDYFWDVRKYRDTVNHTFHAKAYYVDSSSLTSAQIRVSAYSDVITFSRTYGGNMLTEGNAVQQTTDGGYIVIGTVINEANINLIYLVKADNYGDTLWTKIFEEYPNTQGVDVTETTDGGYIIIGTNHKISQPSYCINVDNLGNELWHKVFTNVGGFAIEETIDNCFVILYTPQGKSMLMKLTANGDSVWLKEVTENGLFSSIHKTYDGGVVLVGEISRTSALVRINESGDTLWTKKYNDIYAATEVRQSMDGGFIILCDYYILRTDANGNELWKHDMTDSSVFWQSFQITNDNALVFAGQSYDASELPNFAAFQKTDENGHILWFKSEIDAGWFMSVSQTSDGGYVLVGTTPYADGSTIHLIKTDSNGNIYEKK